ncbi:uncharacterized protein LOC113771758 [Coffea eugenioides]|uniref:uncharacterized protein LOC113771758 n=1 Tax=Coffea eugenioides TaxID=49369 RepID=UPI000F60A7AC|nr:uncharacterized protein LOC113771758 [Coffea eugenioides]
MVGTRRAEKDCRFDTKTVVKNIYILFTGSELQVAKEEQEITDLVDPSTPLPSWLAEEDLMNYANLYERSGFHTALQNKCSFPAGNGRKDYALKLAKIEDCITCGKVKDSVPDLEIIFLPEGNHFVQEQFSEKANKLLVTFLNKHE